MTMPIEVRLPELGDASTLARIGSWLKREGDRVVAGEALLEVETDKTSMEIEAPADGILQKVILQSGTEGVAADALLCLIGEAIAEAMVSRVTEDEALPRTETIANAEVQLPSALQSVAAPPPVAPARLMVVESSLGRTIPLATPLARNIAKLAGADLSRIQPADGVRIGKADVERAITKGAASANRRERAAVDSVKVGPNVSSPYEDRPLSQLRRVTAARLQEAKQTVPHFYVQTDCRVDDLVAIRRQWNSRSGTKVTINDLIIFAASRALHQIPLANSAWAETALRVFSSVDIAVAVSTPAGLIAPVLRGAQGKSIAAISSEMSELIERARTGRLKPSEYTGGSFTISNLGMFGVRAIVPILNPPQACILGIGSIEQRPVVIRDQLAVGQMLTCTLAADHRAIDGATGAEFLSHFRRLIEDPFLLALGS